MEMPTVAGPIHKHGARVAAVEFALAVTKLLPTDDPAASPLRGALDALDAQISKNVRKTTLAA
jgi:hypothetical protein